MNIGTPLAAALLMTASAATAQTLAAPGLGGFGGTTAGSFSLNGASAADDDMLFKCDTPPYAACTAAQLNRRAALRASGTCPPPAGKACVDYLMKNTASSNPAETIAAYTPPEGVQWASPDCQHIPCKLAEKPDAAAGETPAAPSNLKGPPPFDAKDFQKELANARADGKNTIVDLGDNRYGVVLDNGDVSVCGPGKCAAPRPAGDFPGLAAKIQDARQEAASINNGRGSINDGNKSSPGGRGPVSLASSAPSTDGRNAAREQGAEIASNQAGLNGEAAPASGGTPGGAAGAGNQAVIKVDGAVAKAEAAKNGYTYTQIGAAAKNGEDIIQGGAATFNDMANPNRRADPPVDEKYLGKIQAAANQ